MRTIKIINDKKRDAQVGFYVNKNKSDIQMVRSNGQGHKNVRILKSTTDTDINNLLKKYESVEAVAQAILNENPEVEFEKAGMFLNGTKKVYIDENNSIVHRINLKEIVFDHEGNEKEEREFKENIANINEETSGVNWTGKLISKNEAVRKFVFTKSYQIKHINGLTFDFLYDIAKQLQEKDSVMLMGGGKKGNEPLILSDGGTPYRAFLEGRVDGDKYCLIMHLSNLELKTI